MEPLYHTYSQRGVWKALNNSNQSKVLIEYHYCLLSLSKTLIVATRTTTLKPNLPVLTLNLVCNLLDPHEAQLFFLIEKTILTVF